MAGQTPSVTILFITRNRMDDLRRAVQSALSQDIECEILVLDDASTDATVAMMRSEFPSVSLVEAQQPLGVCAQRNRGALLAKGEIIVSIDDDAEFSTPHIVRQTLADFRHPRVAAVWIPYKDIRISPELKSPTPPEPGDWVVASFVGTACAFRRDLFLRMGGYQELLFRETEERELCVHFLNFGYVTLLGSADVILHYMSPVRDAGRNRMWQRRNDVCHAIWNVPFPDLLYHLPGTILNGLRFGLTHDCLPQTISGYFRAIPLVWRTRHLRHPISSKIYRLARRLNRNKVLSLNEVCQELGPMGEWQGSGSGPQPKQFPDTDLSGNISARGSNP
ncbi:GT2 family glycosyltransferase [Roseimicrobium gellanilyticum]|uniref:GT2 family glycosyltransferase n=1 Tax=Roseimicrobium gellanilyticum TaxID=748857 RepID=A0A366HPA0_9BACT|nr:glycosyltransferase family A protein [Roseimicrobium gellanilyticum]RBP45317.1 GT2 family glycosyltransferase [Roseimicrobium gellanilyticum]